MAHSLCAFLFILLLNSFAAAQDQTSANCSRISFVNDASFTDKAGIRKLFKAHDAVPYNPDCLSAECRDRYLKRQKAVVDPILREIDDFLIRLSIRNNLIVLKGSELASISSLLAFDDRFEITNQVVSAFNESKELTTAYLKPILPSSRIGTINTTLFFDSQNGLNGFRGKNANMCDVSSACQDVGKAIDAFMKSNSYTIVLDSSKDLPERLVGCHNFDVTQEFISEFNGKKKT